MPHLSRFHVWRCSRLQYPINTMVCPHYLFSNHGCIDGCVEGCCEENFEAWNRFTWFVREG